MMAGVIAWNWSQLETELEENPTSDGLQPGFFLANSLNSALSLHAWLNDLRLRPRHCSRMVLQFASFE